MILHIMKKDWKLLWRVVVLVAAVQFSLAAMLFHIDHAAVNKNPYGLLLQLILFMTFLGRAVLIVMCVQQDAIPGISQDWLSRPVKRTDLMFAKLAFVLLFAQGPVLIADFFQALAGGCFLPALLVDGYYTKPFPASRLHASLSRIRSVDEESNGSNRRRGRLLSVPLRRPDAVCGFERG